MAQLPLKELVKEKVARQMDNVLDTSLPRQAQSTSGLQAQGSSGLQSVVSRARNLILLNSSRMQSSSVNTSAAFQPPKRRKISARSYVMPSQKKEAPVELKSFELVLLQYADPQDFKNPDGTIPDVIPDYSKTDADILCTGMVDILTNANESSVRECINEVLITRIEDLRCEDFDFVKVKGKKVSTPAFKKGQEIGCKQVRSLARQGAIYVRLNKNRNVNEYISDNSKDEESPYSCNAAPDVVTCIPEVSSEPLLVDDKGDDDTKIMNRLTMMFPTHPDSYLQEVVKDSIDLAHAVDTIISDDKAKESLHEPASLPGKCTATCRPKSVLSAFQEKIADNSGQDYPIHVKREGDLFKQVTLIYKRASINDLKKRPNVTFAAGNLKELGSDAGGPTREFMHLAMTALLEQEVSGCLLFTGDVDHLIPVHNWDLLDDGAFITAGKVVAHSVLHGGQGFIGMSPAVVAYIETHDLDKALISTCIEDVPDIDVRETISLILTSTKDRLPNLRIQNPAVLDLLDDCGVVNLQEDNRHKAVQKILLQQVIIKRKNEIEDIMKGMDSLSLLSFLKSHPCISPLVFTKKTEATPSVEEVQNLIVAEDNTSLTGSQERALDFLKAYVANLGSRAEGNSFCPEALTPLQECIHFCTGTPYIPSYLGERKISVGFARHPRAIYPKANTCFWKLQLPTCYTSFPAFTESFDKCIEIEGRGFMIA